MKPSIFTSLIALSLFTSVFVFADEPCPTPIKANNVAEGEGGCAADLDQPPTHFDFGALKQQMNEAKDAPAAQEANAPKDANAPEPVRQDEAADAKNAQNAQRVTPKTCTYSAYAWDTKKKRSTDHFSVQKRYDEVTDDERDPNDPRCTICSEDQVSIDTSAMGLKTGNIKICWVYAENVRNALRMITESGEFDIEKLEGYRPGKTRGKIDQNGLRTQWSNHSFGAAIDINAHKNAIYSKCTQKITYSKDDVSGCKRGIGGAYDPQKNPRTSITRDGIVYKAFIPFWKWGGEINGETKDIMHFSITGY